jgi:hypothetical protein
MRDPDFFISLLALSIVAIVPQLADLSDDELAELLAQEQAGSNRKGLVDAITLDQAHRASAAEDAAKAAAPAAAPEKLADWQEPDYAGPLHGGQAAWRNANLKANG